ncbi:MAG: sigma-54-dependent transcriptional regulator [Myxococcota bacterium]
MSIFLEAEPTVILVEDDESMSVLLVRWLKREGFQAEVFKSAEALLEGLTRSLPDAICVDLHLPGMSGMELLPLIRQRYPSLPVIFLTVDTSVELVVQAMQLGAYDYLAKPIERTRFLTTIRNAVQKHRLSTRVEQLEQRVQGRTPTGMVGRSAAMLKLFEQLTPLAASDITVLIHGESGTGKELLARALHDDSPRCKGPFIALNCAAVPEGLEDSELFGHEKGAFTGAQQSRLGRFERANGGTLFLDEVAELSLSLQARLLRVLQERRFERVGGSRQLESDFRMVTATHRDLSAMVKAGSFREDLYYRIAVFELEVPPLRARAGDIPLLVSSFLERHAAQTGTTPLKVEPEAMQLLESWSWPGNVRELENVVLRAAVLAREGLIRPEHVAQRLHVKAVSEPVGARGPGASVQVSAQAVAQATHFRAPAALPSTGSSHEPGQPAVSSAARSEPDVSSLQSDARFVVDLRQQPLTAEEAERWLLERTLELCEGSLTRTVERLKISRTTLYRKLQSYRHETDS